MFPFDKEIIVSEALAYSRNGILDKNATGVLKNALYYDPYSAELLGMYTQYAYYFGNKNEAKLALSKLKEIAPNSNILKQVSERVLK